MTDEHPIEREIRKLNAQRLLDEVQLRKEWVHGLCVVLGMLVVFASVVAVLWAWADSDLTDALQECGLIRVAKDETIGDTKMRNESVDACRRMAFEYYGGLKK